MKKSKNIKVILDVNWFISACISQKSRRVLFYLIFKNPFVTVYYSPELLAEFSEVMARPTFSMLIKPQLAERFLQIALQHLTITRDSITDYSVRNTADDYLLGIGKSCKANYLITGDQDLLVLKQKHRMKIVTMNQLMEHLPFFDRKKTY